MFPGSSFKKSTDHHNKNVQIITISVWISVISKTLSIHTSLKIKTYAECPFGIPDQFMINVTKYFFSRAYKLDALDVVIAATTGALIMQVNIVQNVNGKVTVINHVPVISGSFRGTVYLHYMPSHNNQDDHYVAMVDMIVDDIIQKYEDDTQGSDVSSQPQVYRNGGMQLEEHEQDKSSGQVGHAPQEEMLMYDISEYSGHLMMSGGRRRMSNRHMGYGIVSQDAEEDMKLRTFTFSLYVTLMKISSKV